MATIPFVGFGLLAGSLAQAIRNQRPEMRIIAVSSSSSCQYALKNGLADKTCDYEQLESVLNETDLLLLCSPISHILSLLEMLPNFASSLSHPILVSDIGSTKARVCQQGAMLPAPFIFVGGHPMAGSEKRGADHADASLFENAYWILCPENIPETSYQLLTDVVLASGAHPVQMDAQEHDLVMARLSHVPQMVSTALAAGLHHNIIENGQQHLAGRGFRDMTRIAASPWPMWRDIVATNQPQILAGLQEFRQSLEQLEESIIKTQTQPSLEAIFAQGGAVRASLSNPGKGFAQPLHEIIVQIPDQPGTLLGVISPISKANLNILDMEIAKVREGIGGTLLLGFKTLEEAHQAEQILLKLHFQVRLRS